MTLTNASLAELLLQLGQQYVDAFQAQLGHYPLVEKDEQWLSPCQREDFNDELVTWQPVKIQDPLSFENIESALEISLHPDISSYFSSIYSESIQAKCDEGHLSLLFAWNKDDFERLQENIIGHIMMKKKLKQPLTIFFAVTDQDDLILSINNDSGEIWVERVGKEPHKKVANNLAEFIKSLSPYVEMPVKD